MKHWTRVWNYFPSLFPKSYNKIDKHQRTASSIALALAMMSLKSSHTYSQFRLWLMTFTMLGCLASGITHVGVQELSTGEGSCLNVLGAVKRQNLAWAKLTNLTNTSCYSLCSNFFIFFFIVMVLGFHRVAKVRLEVTIMEILNIHQLDSRVGKTPNNIILKLHPTFIS